MKFKVHSSKLVVITTPCRLMESWYQKTTQSLVNMSYNSFHKSSLHLQQKQEPISLTFSFLSSYCDKYDEIQVSFYFYHVRVQSYLDFSKVRSFLVMLFINSCHNIYLTATNINLEFNSNLKRVTFLKMTTMFVISPR